MNVLSSSRGTFCSAGPSVEAISRFSPRPRLPLPPPSARLLTQALLSVARVTRGTPGLAAVVFFIMTYSYPKASSIPESPPLAEATPLPLGFRAQGERAPVFSGLFPAGPFSAGHCGPFLRN